MTGYHHRAYYDTTLVQHYPFELMGESNKEMVQHEVHFQAVLHFQMVKYAKKVVGTPRGPFEGADNLTVFDPFPLSTYLEHVTVTFQAFWVMMPIIFGIKTISCSCDINMKISFGVLKNTYHFGIKLYFDMIWRKKPDNGVRETSEYINIGWFNFACGSVKVKRSEIKSRG